MRCGADDTRAAASPAQAARSSGEARWRDAFDFLLMITLFFAAAPPLAANVIDIDVTLTPPFFVAAIIAAAAADARRPAAMPPFRDAADFRRH
jgi:hypothetical protein